LKDLSCSLALHRVEEYRFSCGRNGAEIAISASDYRRHV